MMNFSKYAIIKKLKKFLKELTPPVYVIKKPKTEEGIDGLVVSCADRHSHIAEQFKVLRTNLYSLSPERSPKSIVITSSQAQEGKSLVVANLAFTLSLESKNKILLIDADLRRPVQHKMFGISRKPGFSDILKGEADIKQFFEKPAAENLYIIPAGTITSAASELLNSTRLREIIERLKTKFNFIIFDTPPVLNVTDSSVLGALCDTVLFVVRSGVTQKSVIEEAFTLLKNANAQPHASILTDTSVPAYYYYYKYKYYYAYAYAKQKRET